MMRGYEYSRHREFSDAFESLPDRVNCPEFKPIAEAFSSNIGKVRDLGRMPISINFWSSLFAAYMVQSRNDSGIAHLDRDTDESRKRANELYHNWRKKHNSLPNEEIQKLIWSTSHGNLDEYVDKDRSGEIRRGIEAVFSSMIMISWAAFETIATDLWVAAVNKHPEQLVKTFSEKHSAKNFSLGVFEEYGFDLSNKMGQVLYEKEKAEFKTLEGLKAAYRDTFGKDVVSIFDSKPNLLEAKFVRNLLAHRAGIIDRKFLSNTSKIPHFSHLQIGDTLPLAGPDVARNIDACVSTGVELTLFVDNWSKMNC